MKCPICGCENPDDYKFCHDCGSPLNFTESIDDLTSELNNLDDFPSFDSLYYSYSIRLGQFHP